MSATTSTAVDAVLSRLAGVRPDGNGWKAICPAHLDQKPSLKVDVGDDGRILLFCHAGCDTDDIVAALGLTMADLFARERMNGHAPPTPPKIVAIYDYGDEAGALRFQVVRKVPKTFSQRRPDGRGGWIWNLQGVVTVPYHLDELIAAPPDATVWIFEGEKDVDLARQRGLTATCNPMGAGKWRDHHAAYLAGRSVAIVPDDDDAGRAHAQQVATSCHAAGCRVRIVALPGLGDKGDFTDWIEAGGTSDHLGALMRRTPEWAPSAGDREPEWLDPIPLTMTHDLPDAPVWVFPAWLRDYVEQLFEETQTQPDLSLVMALGVLSTAAARTFVVRVRDGWTEPVNTYGLAAQESGTRKTAVVTAFSEPIRDYEAALIEAAGPEIAKATTRKRILEKQLEAAERDAAKEAAGDNAKRLAAEAVAMELARLAVPAEPRLLADDVTTEKAVSILAGQGRIAILTDEGGIFVVIGGAYSQSGAVNVDVLLKGHAGSDIRVDRVSRPSEVVRKPAVTMALVVQPSVLEGLAATPSFRGKGLLARFAYVVPRSRVGRRNARSQPMKAKVAERYRTNITALLAFDPPRQVDASGTPKPIELALTDDARERLVRFLEELEPKLSPHGSLGHIADWGGKLAGLCARYAGLLHLAEQVDTLFDGGDELDPTIDAVVVERAITVGRYLIPHALTAFAIMGADPATNDARYLLGVIQARGLQTCPVRDLFQATKGMLKKMDRLKTALGVLEDHQMLRVAQVDDKTGAGRKKSPVVTINPMVIENRVNSENSENRSPVADEVRF